MKEGRIINFDGFIGEIESEDKTYLFLSDDTLNEVQNGDFVNFRAEDIHEIRRAFFIKSKNDNVVLSMRSYDNEK